MLAKSIPEGGRLSSKNRPEINRSLIVLKSKQPFLDWGRSLDDESEALTLAVLAEDSTAYLVPEIFLNSDQPEILGTCYDILFEEQLAGWSTDETSWPQSRDLKLFLDWFEVQFHSLILDLCDGPILKDAESDLGNG